MAKREYVQLAYPIDHKKHLVAGKYASPKLDGERAIYDGGASRGLYADEVPYANTAKDKKRFYATGLWTRRGKVIHAPASFLDALPKMVLDGELWLGNGKFQTLSSIVRNQSGTSDWTPIRYCIFDAPPVETWLADGMISDTIFKKLLVNCYKWWLERAKGITVVTPQNTFRQRQLILKMAKLTEPCIWHPQTLLADNEQEALAKVDEMLDEVLFAGGEGLILKSPNNIWKGERTHDMLKVKPRNDMEAVVVGYTSGRETDKGSRLLGKMGSLLLKIPAGEFGVSGFSDNERILSGFNTGITATQWASANPDSVCPDWITNALFPRGSTVTIKYRELSDSGIPKEAQFFRKFNSLME